MEQSGVVFRPEKWLSSMGPFKDPSPFYLMASPSPQALPSACSWQKEMSREELV